ncbi:hypothetical protein CHLRE_05g234892v5 [Chlamydomonas reinhardtii]|uniref:Uncharacterized protein n=1 Tax=Chlamydomonas reinhardtii TaxID=3055 RepID=A0A2K3DSQ0_CHLRE|nr:uncharacterized protein CHLRE_05g234892v5 [Chlamydomonas reinhardtii]XP_042924799.1 uncharacterized protein CHLRE_05g234892v5 [Chlamydomonas reinhardtii]PNW83562.1 hypothetical protein CHLRE_05g234892v5 [Chlamydomonas reinhardtii]PNW83563.1 hypothetical protein CHLRE_05g234892v5 [Chlamydomonas reinhardtii]
MLQLSRLELCGSRDQYAHQTAYKKLLTAQLKAAQLEHFVAIWTAGGALCEVEEVQALAGVTAPGRLWAFLHSASCSGLEPA